MVQRLCFIGNYTLQFLTDVSYFEQQDGKSLEAIIEKFACFAILNFCKCERGDHSCSLRILSSNVSVRVPIISTCYVLFSCIKVIFMVVMVKVVIS